jgi:methionyl-tRNA synthetase
MAKFYITCAIPYVNAPPHVGHALEFVQGDVIARYHELLGEDTLLLSGGDENALKNVQAAEKSGIPLKEFIDTNGKKEAILYTTSHLHKNSGNSAKKTSLKNRMKAFIVLGVNSTIRRMNSTKMVNASSTPEKNCKKSKKKIIFSGSLSIRNS